MSDTTAAADWSHLPESVQTLMSRDSSAFTTIMDMQDHIDAQAATIGKLRKLTERLEQDSDLHRDLYARNVLRLITAREAWARTLNDIDELTTDSAVDRLGLGVLEAIRSRLEDARAALAQDKEPQDE